MIKQMLSAITKIKHWQAYLAAIMITFLFCVAWPMFSPDENTQGYWPGFSSGIETTLTDGYADGSLESRMAETLSAMKGVGKVSVVIAYEEEAVEAFSSAQSKTAQKPRGAIIVAEGASSVWVKMELCRAVHALLGLDMASIEVFEMSAATSIN